MKRERISIKDFREVLKDERDNPSYDFIDVRTAGEYKQGHIDGVRNIPLDTIVDRFKEFTVSKKVYLHCRSGSRSAMAVEIFDQLGFSETVVNVDGGIVAWEEAGFMVI